ncbi:MAG: SDR family NAD(P)-dependent oxidoreductase [Paludibacteraceae bacterium]|nr:SDR family NAD(P)-dependent oxidoreductase [Paludibacteraceae bacterium]
MEENTSTWALVTGASSGIGLRYATALARDYKYNVILVSNQEKELDLAAEDISSQYGVKAETLFMNLAAQNAAEQVYKFCKDKHLEVDVLVNNAGILIFDAFRQTDTHKIETLLMLHIVTLTKLCRLFAADMAERKRGYILNMSSMSAWMSMPSIACYNASKGYILNFSKALWYEMRRHNVRVLAVTPGSTDTGLLPFGKGFGRVLRFFGITMSPERLVNRALKVLFRRRKKTCMPGAWNYIIVPIINHLPDWLVLTAMRQIKLNW